MASLEENLASGNMTAMMRNDACAIVNVGNVIFSWLARTNNFEENANVIHTEDTMITFPARGISIGGMFCACASVCIVLSRCKSSTRCRSETLFPSMPCRMILLSTSTVYVACMYVLGYKKIHFA